MEWVLNLNPIPMIRGSASQIRSLLGYLIQNAREAMPKGQGTITIHDAVWTRGTGSIMEIRDSGRGMTPEVLKRATEPFFTTKSGRSGIGLTVAHGIWRRHRGALSIESQPGEGTMIRLAVEAHGLGSRAPNSLRRAESGALSKKSGVRDRRANLLNFARPVPPNVSGGGTRRSLRSRLIRRSCDARSRGCFLRTACAGLMVRNLHISTRCDRLIRPRGSGPVYPSHTATACR